MLISTVSPEDTAPVTDNFPFSYQYTLTFTDLNPGVDYNYTVEIVRRNNNMTIQSFARPFTTTALREFADIVYSMLVRLFSMFTATTEMPQPTTTPTTPSTTAGTQPTGAPQGGCDTTCGIIIAVVVVVVVIILVIIIVVIIVAYKCTSESLKPCIILQ